MKTSEQINDIAGALAKAQGQMRPAIKDALNPHFRAKYLDLPSVWDALREPLYKNDLAILQDVTLEDKGVSVYTRIIHASGQWVEFGPYTVPVSKYDAHGVGSATSYAKRYSLCAAIGVVGEEDDDGNAATKKPEAKISDEEYKKFCEKCVSEYGEIFNLFLLQCLDSSNLSKKEMVASYIRNYDTFKKKISEFGVKHGSKTVPIMPEVPSSLGIPQDGEI